MSAIRTFFAQHEAKAPFAVWVLLPTIFLFFALTLAVDPSTQLSKVRLGVAVLDAGVQTPQGQMAVGSHLVEGFHQQLPVEIVSFQTESALREAVLAHDVSGGIIFPANMTQNMLAKQQATLQVVKSDANDPFTNAFLTNLSTQIAANINTILPQILSGQPNATPRTPPLVTVASTLVAATTDFRFATLPVVLVLPLWIATVAFAALLSRVGNKVRRMPGISPVETGLIELSAGLVGSALAAAVITLDIGLFSWRGDLDFAGLFGLLWVGLLAGAWLIQGTIRLLGFELGVPLAVLGLFIQQPVSGAAFPAAFAPDVVGWAESIAPLRYLVEGLRNVLIGGSTTGEMLGALALLAGAGLVPYAAGMARLSLVPNRQRPPQTAPSA